MQWWCFANNPEVLYFKDSQFPIDSGPHSRVYAAAMQAAAIRIGELAKRTTLSIDAIRFYEKRQLLSKAPRSAGGFRLYTAGDIEQLRFIRQMQRLGFSLREIRELTDLRSKKTDACESVRELLKHKIKTVRAKLDDLNRLEIELAADLEKCNKELRHRRRYAACACPVLEEVATR